MSDLTATNCGCGNSCSRSNNCGSVFGGNNSCIWIILLLVFCGGNGNGIFGRNNGCDDCDNGCGNNCCEWLIWILILSSFCGNNNGCGCGC